MTNLFIHILVLPTANKKRYAFKNIATQHFGNMIFRFCESDPMVQLGLLINYYFIHFFVFTA